MQETKFQHNPNDRVRNLSPEKLNKQIDQKTDQLLHGLKSCGPEVLRARIRKIDREWDIDRAAMLVYSGILLAQVANALKKHQKNWSWFSIIQTPFLLLHATVGWSPHVPLLRKLGFRTRFEIQEEREELLKILSYEDPLNEAGIYGKA